MKNTMKKLTAALLAMACVPVTGLTAAADVPFYWGITVWEEFEDMEPFDDHGSFTTGNAASKYFQDPESNQAFLRMEGNGQAAIIVACPRQNHMLFILREDADIDEAGTVMAEVLEKYFPGFKDGFDAQYYAAYKELGYKSCISYENEQARLSNTYNSTGRTFDLYVKERSGITDELETEMLHTLARKHMISEFYGWGATAEYATGYYDGGTQILLQCYETSYYSYDYTNKKEIVYQPDYDAVQAYLSEHYPGLTMESYDTGETVSRWNEDETEIIHEPRICYRINGAENLSLHEKVELDCELWEQFGIETPCGFLESANPTATGHNALERPGDTNLDCVVNILDVIAANKHILGVGTLDKTGSKNADMNGNGTTDSEDSLAILKAALYIDD